MPIRIQDIDAVRVVTLDRPSRANAYDAEMLGDLADVFDRSETDPAVRVLVLTGAGDRAFCAGMDLKSTETTVRPGVSPTLFSERFYKKPVVAAVNGDAVGGGLGLVLAADIVVAADHARFGIPEVSRGLVGVGVVSRAATKLAVGTVLELALTGDLVDAARARDMGIVQRVTTLPELMPSALAVGARIAANAPLAVAAAKEVVFEVAALGRVDIPAMRARVAHVAASADAQEGRRAFRERRQPVFEGA